MPFHLPYPRNGFYAKVTGVWLVHAIWSLLAFVLRICLRLVHRLTDARMYKSDDLLLLLYSFSRRFLNLASH